MVSERLGHASIHITLDTYSHVLSGMQEQVVQAFEEALQGTPPQPHAPEETRCHTNVTRSVQSILIQK